MQISRFRPSKNMHFSVEFVMERDGSIIPVIDGNLGVSENKIVLPHFMAMFL